MDYYIDIRLRPDPEFKPTVLMNALYAKLHKVLVQLKATQIGVSFPLHGTKDASGKVIRHLGEILRVHGPQAALAQLQAQSWIGAMSESVQVMPISVIPTQVQHRSVRRVQIQSSPERIQRRLVKRLMAREDISEAEASVRITRPPALMLNDPYLTVQSTSTGQRFRLFVRHHPAQAQASTGVFNAYGLSTTASLPWF